ncbi:MAG: hypothetical protein KC425_07705 [Anaerolineales bacterium]|nr:hypothetical protein [Anaerolineales bacterium]
MQLSRDRFEQAVAFIHATAREVDKALFAYEFEGGPATAVLAALAAYQNDDGGFGLGLEPDFRMPASSPMATSVALQVATAVAAPAEHPLVAGAIAYLIDSFEADHAYWPATSPAVNEAPHAFWWHVDDPQPPTEAQWPNPSAELVGYLHRYASWVAAPLLAQATARARANLAHSAIISGDEVQKYNILCWQRAMPHLPADLAAEVAATIRATYAHWAPDSPEAFGEMSVVPFAPGPDAILARQFPALVDALLDAEIGRQAADGGWWPGWHWGQYADVWPVAEREWAGKLTLENLLALRAFGKLAG